MTTSESMLTAEVEIFRHQAIAINRVAALTLNGITEEDSLIQPAGGGNCINWILGHLACIYNSILPMLGQDKIQETETISRYARGSLPIRDSSEALSLEKLRRAWEDTSARVEAGISNLTFAVLESPAPFSPRDDSSETARTLLTTILFHQAYHVGQLALLRRVAGKEGAIR